ncbi:protein FAR1-RELATED SEQUENCE 8-like [Lycium ferocissimum]|uniref:protein FAR1-RELATED SEQUENCE 8-like n=1 Tax=Lycium ferocissimum TaxID=112874 RepID=UPI0028154F4D|nr:protein FAR1-RELATED SEQUENCE 8-like [Lycium ferocissimum]
MDPNNGNSDNDLRETLNNVLEIQENDSLFSNVGGGEGEDSDGSFIGGPDAYLDSEDEELNLMCLEEEANMPDQLEEDDEDPMPDQHKYEAHVTDEDEDEDREGMDEDTFTHQQLVQGTTEGMIFNTKDSMFAFYREHARLKGFGVLKKSAVKKCSDTINYIVFACDKRGKVKRYKQSKKIKCKAQINDILLHDGSWRVNKLVGDHNHPLDPKLSRFMPSHRDVSNSLKRHLVAHDIVGIRPSKSIRLLEVQAGGPENLRCTPKDCRNYILHQRRLRTLSTDAEAINRFFLEMQIQDREFFYAVHNDNSGRLRNCVWFHTHYRQSILLGCALITSEDAKTYKYVFSTCLRAMNGLPPTAILTDQCESIKVAIREVMPDAIHSGYSTLKQFVEKYEMALRAKYDKELEEQRILHCALSIHENAELVEGVEKYIITDFSIRNDFHGNQFVFLVEYRLGGPYLECNGKNFESTGIV